MTDSADYDVLDVFRQLGLMDFLQPGVWHGSHVKIAWLNIPTTKGAKTGILLVYIDTKNSVINVNPASPKNDNQTGDLVTLPLLPTHSDQAIEQLLSQRDCRQSKNCSRLIHDFQSVRDIPICSPTNHNLRFPTQSSLLLELFDILDRYSEYRLESLVCHTLGAFLRVGAERNAWCRCGGRDVDPALGTFITSSKINGAGYSLLGRFGEYAEMIFRM